MVVEQSKEGLVKALDNAVRSDSTLAKAILFTSRKDKIGLPLRRFLRKAKLFKDVRYVQNCHTKFWGPNRMMQFENKQRNSFTTQSEVLVFNVVIYAQTEMVDGTVRIPYVLNFTRNWQRNV